MIRQVSTRRKSTNDNSCEKVTKLDEEKMNELLSGSESTRKVWMRRKWRNGKSFEKGMFERPENVIPTAVQTWQRVLASLFPETSKDEHFQKVEKRVSVETCEKTQPTLDGVNGLSATQDSCRRIWNRQPFHVASLGYSNSFSFGPPSEPLSSVFVAVCPLVASSMSFFDKLQNC